MGRCFSFSLLISKCYPGIPSCTSLELHIHGSPGTHNNAKKRLSKHFHIAFLWFWQKKKKNWRGDFFLPPNVFLHFCPNEKLQRWQSAASESSEEETRQKMQIKKSKNKVNIKRKLKWSHKRKGKKENAKLIWKNTVENKQKVWQRHLSGNEMSVANLHIIGYSAWEWNKEMHHWHRVTEIKKEKEN